MGKYPKYLEYKDSGVEWLGEIPGGWEVKKLKYLGEAIIGLTYAPDDVVDDESEGVLVLRSSNVQNKKLAFDDNVYVKKKISEKLKTRKGDILVCARNGSRALIGKNAMIDENATGITFGAFMSIFRSLYNDYLSKVFNSALFEYQSGTFLTSTINQLTTANLNNFEVPFPPKNDRDAITNFLNHETDKIDHLIEKQQQLIELLKEKRQAVISHAVTKGIDPKVPMKDSEVEWLGEVPVHWTIKPLKYLGTYNDEVIAETTKKDYEIQYIDIGSVSATQGISNIETMLFADAPSRARRVVHDGDVIVSTVRTYLEAIAPINNPPENLVVSTGFAVIRPTTELYKEYAAYCLRAKGFIQEVVARSVGVSYPAINASELVNIKIPKPDIFEQTQIANVLDHEIAKIDYLIQKAEQQIFLMQERRTALISAAVTGKIDVRNWQAPNYEAQKELCV